MLDAITVNRLRALFRLCQTPYLAIFEGDWEGAAALANIPTDLHSYARAANTLSLMRCGAMSGWVGWDELSAFGRRYPGEDINSSPWAVQQTDRIQFAVHAHGWSQKEHCLHLVLNHMMGLPTSDDVAEVCRRVKLSSPLSDRSDILPSPLNAPGDNPEVPGWPERIES